MKRKYALFSESKPSAESSADSSRDASKEKMLFRMPLPAFFRAIRAGSIDEVESMLDQDSSLAFRHDRDGYTGMHYAAMYNKTEVIKILFNQGGASLVRETEDHQTPLMLAKRYKKLEAINLINDLLEREQDSSLSRGSSPSPH